MNIQATILTNLPNFPDRDAQENILEGLYVGFGGAELANKFSSILEQIDDDLLLGWIKQMPNAKLKFLYEALPEDSIKLRKAIEIDGRFRAKLGTIGYQRQS